MRILLINKYHYLRGGAERAYFDTAAALRARGHEVAFFSMKHPENEPTPWEKYFVENVEYADEASMPFSRKFRAVKNIVWNAEAARNLGKLIDEFKPDIAHLHNIYHQLSPSVIRMLKRRGIPMVMTLHDYKLISPNYSLFVRGKIWDYSSGFRCLLDRCVKDSFLKSLVCAVEQWAHRAMGVYRDVDAFIAPSRFLIGKFKEHGFASPIRLVRQPIVPFPEHAAPESAPDALFVFFGRLSAEKGVKTLIRAIAKTFSAKLRIIGDGPEKESLEELVHKLELGDRIAFLGFRAGDDLWKEIAAAKAVVFPSVWYENMPYAVLEAMAHGKVVIASRIGGVPEVIRDGENGKLFPPGDHSALAAILDEVTRDPARYASLGSAARATVSGLTSEAYYSEIIEVYEGLVGKKAA